MQTASDLAFRLLKIVVHICVFRALSSPHGMVLNTIAYMMKR